MRKKILIFLGVLLLGSLIGFIAFKLVSDFPDIQNESEKTVPIDNLKTATISEAEEIIKNRYLNKNVTIKLSEKKEFYFEYIIIDNELGAPIEFLHFNRINKKITVEQVSAISPPK